jgi:hypothetical protein
MQKMKPINRFNFTKAFVTHSAFALLSRTRADSPLIVKRMFGANIKNPPKNGGFLSAPGKILFRITLFPGIRGEIG